jgi:UDP-glucose 4-epimerase
LGTRPRSPHAASKVAAEAFLLAYQAAFKLPSLALRFFNVYAPLQPSRARLFGRDPRLRRRRPPWRTACPHGDGEQVRDFTFVGAVVSVLADAVLGRMTISPHQSKDVAAARHDVKPLVQQQIA